MTFPKTPALTTDCVVFDARGRVLLIRRGQSAVQGQIRAARRLRRDRARRVEDACRRELMEETGVKAGRLELVGVYSDPGRDPRGHTCSVVFLARVGQRHAEGRRRCRGARNGSRTGRRLDLAFDHAKILRDAQRACCASDEEGGERG